MSSLRFHNATHPKDAVAITPHDSNDLAELSVLYIGTSGNLVINTEAGTQVTFNNVPVGFFPVPATRVYATNTTATDIVALKMGDV